MFEKHILVIFVFLGMAKPRVKWSGFQHASFRVEIYRAWIESFESEGLPPGLATYYHYLKTCVGIQLTPASEKEVTKWLSGKTMLDLNPGDLAAAEAYGFFRPLPEGWPMWEAVLWSRECGRRLFFAMGIGRSQEMIQALDLQLVYGKFAQPKRSLPQGLSRMEEAGISLKQLALHNGLTIPQVVAACLAHTP